MKTYILNCKDFGRKFTFNAKDDKDATKKLRDYEEYHSTYGQHTVIETTEKSPADLNNRYVM